MTVTLENQPELDALESRITTLLPEQYHDVYEDVKPVSMGSAVLKYLLDGSVAWNEIWGSFCDLAMAGGPPHKGLLLEPGSPSEIDSQPAKYRKIVDEICRGVRMVSDLDAKPAPIPGWVRVTCDTETMAGWLVRAIVMENVSARGEGNYLDLPAGPGYRIEKEVKNVITVIAKTCHYWLGHTESDQQYEIADLLSAMAVSSPLIQPTYAGYDFDAVTHEPLAGKIAGMIQEATGLAKSSGHQYSGWLGLACADVPAAVWMTRALVASNVLSRRENTVLFVPVNPATDPDGERVAQSVIRIHGFAVSRAVIPPSAL